MRAGRAFATAALVFLFLAEGQRAYFATLAGFAYDAVHPAPDAGRLLLVLLPVAPLFAPLLPLARWLDRGSAIAVAAAGVAVFRVPMSLPHVPARVIGSALVLAFTALFLAWAVGWLDRRALAGGAVAGLVADQLLRLAGSSWDLSLRAGWVPVQAALSLTLIGLVVLRPPVPEILEPGPERRAGGLRLRGAVALGTLVFLDLHLLSLPAVAARWTGASYAAAALAVSTAGGLAAALTLAWPAPIRGRWPAVGMVLIIGTALLGGGLVEGVAGALLLAAGHGAALLLVARALHPASGRRSPALALAALLAMVIFTGLYAATFSYPSAAPPLPGGTPWVLAAAVALLAGAFLLLPQPAFVAPRAGRLTGGAVAVAVPLVAVLLLLALAPPAPPAPPAAGSERGAGGGHAARGVRAGTYNLHYGLAPGGRFDADAIARAIASADADLVALQEVGVGMPTAYGMDLPLWLERRLGIRGSFAASGGRLQGQAILARVRVTGLDAATLATRDGHRAHLVRAEAVLRDGPVGFHAVHVAQSVHDGRAGSLTAALASIPRGPAAVAVDVGAEARDPITAALRDTGFRDALGPTGGGAVAAPVLSGAAGRVPGLWVRELDVVAAEVLPGPSGQRLVVATLQRRPTDSPPDH